MPYVNIRVTSGVTKEQKLKLIEGVTDLVGKILATDPTATFVIIDDIETDNWGMNRQSMTQLRVQEVALEFEDKTG
jgi:4-oxalocrotonate tautomerase